MSFPIFLHSLFTSYRSHFRNRPTVLIDESQHRVGPFPGVIDTDAFADGVCWWRGAVIREEQLSARQVEAVLGTSDAEGAGEFTGAGEVGVPVVERLSGADQDGLSVTRHAGHDIEHRIHTVDEINVG